VTTLRYVYGLDPASKSDYFGIVVHALRDGKTPKLVALDALTNTSFDRLYDHLTNDTFRKYPPYHMVIDYTNEKTFSDMLVERYGKRKVELIHFSTGTKQQLKEDGLSILNQGYRFPNPKSKSPQVAQHIHDLLTQLQHEQIVLTKTGKTTFDHPSGEHNDLAIAWELSIHGCLRFMNKKPYTPVVVSRKYDIYGSSDNVIGSGIPRHLQGIEPISWDVVYPGGA
jgi:hypothetical protein